VSHPIDVGSVLGGRYKVTANVLTSHDQDLVLDGVDQVLNRPVSILVAGPGNAEQVAQSAREVATGERPGNVQILDLGVSDAATYLITNHTSAADLLDLVVATNPPYVEPFFTDTLGSEIFGQPRSREPETYDGLYDDDPVEADYINYDDVQRRQQNPYPAAPVAAPAAFIPSPNGKLKAAGKQGKDQLAAGQAGQDQESRGGSSRLVPPPPPVRPAARPASGPAARAAGNGASGNGAAGNAAAGVAGAAGAVGGAAAANGAANGAAGAAAAPASEASTAPQPVQHEDAHSSNSGPSGVEQVLAARNGRNPAPESPKVSLWSDHDYGHGNDDQPDYPAAPASRDHSDRHAGGFAAASVGAHDYDDDDEEPAREPRSMRWLVGGILAAVLIVGLVFAVTNLGSFFQTGSDPAAGTAPETTTAPQATSAEPSAAATSEPVAGPPVIEEVTRTGNFDFAATYDVDLAKTFDGNAASYWSDMEFATANWGGLAAQVPLMVKLEKPSQVSSITLSQLGASGGSISVFTNDRPSMDGAKQVGTNSFTSPDLTMPLAAPVTAQYVMVSIERLPALAAPKTRYGFGLRLAEIKVQ
jgi:hypothetical protein